MTVKVCLSHIILYLMSNLWELRNRDPRILLFYSLPILIYHFFGSSCLLESMGHLVQVGPWTIGGSLSLNWFTAFFSESSMWSVSLCQETWDRTRGGSVLGRAWSTSLRDLCHWTVSLGEDWHWTHKWSFWIPNG